jgi:preprotein translocase subunit YajC
MTFNKGYYLGYLVFVLAMVIVYFTVPREYGFYALITLAIIFGLYQFVLISKRKKASKS